MRAARLRLDNRCFMRSILATNVEAGTGRETQHGYIQDPDHPGSITCFFVSDAPSVLANQRREDRDNGGH